MNISLVPQDHIMSIWNSVRGHLEPAVAVSRGRWTMEHLCAALSIGRSQLWIAFDDEKIHGALTTEITQYPGKKILSMHFLGGEGFDAWYEDLLSQITRYAKDMDCDGIEGVGRFGFWKWLEQDEFSRSYVVYERSLEDE